jgi:hypothetical protein
MYFVQKIAIYMVVLSPEATIRLFTRGMFHWFPSASSKNDRFLVSRRSHHVRYMEGNVGAQVGHLSATEKPGWSDASSPENTGALARPNLCARMLRGGESDNQSHKQQKHRKRVCSFHHRCGDTRGRMIAVRERPAASLRRQNHSS